MKHFGPNKHTDLTKEAMEQTETPEGASCGHCSEVIVFGDRGFVLPLLDDTGNVGQDALHHECFMRMVLGSVGHQKGKCGCNGGTEEDPKGMTIRQAAKASVEYFNELKVVK